MKKITSTKLFKIFLISIFFIFLISLNPYRFVGFFGNIFLTLAIPFQKIAYSSSIKFSNTKDFISSIGQLKRENENLIKENIDLTADISRLKDTEKENIALREQLNLSLKNQYELANAFVVGHDPNGQENWIEIDKGSSDGIEVNMPVIIAEGVLIGRVQEVYFKTAKIILLTNSKSVINGIDVETEAKGVIKGEYGLGLIFDMVLQSDFLNIGDSIITSGIGGDMPKGLFIGKVKEVHFSEDHLFQQAVVSVPIPSSKIKVVSIIKNYKSY